MREQISLSIRHVTRWGVYDFNKYLLVGSLAFVIDAGILMILVYMELYYIFANTISFLTANIFNFAIGHYFIFKRYVKKNIFHIYTIVFAVSCIGLLLNNLSMFLFVELMFLPILIAKILSTIICLFWNYFGRKKIAYA
jgi:putative flippase GtrA